ncbi:hypothetical protein ASG43_05115 [Aureimonas sp. Leaf454]|nr:hypothetical protein ASG43_05115 [Aureimonas sp. Leaf454]
MNAAPEGSTFVFESGVHRLAQAIVPKNGQTFIGQEGAVLDGSRTLTSFEREGSLFVAGGQTQEGLRIATDEAIAPRGGYPETLFIDGRPLTPVGSVADVTAGTFFFDYAADKIFLADNPAGHTVEAGVASAAFESDASGVGISNLVIQQFNAPTQHGAIQGGEGWTIQNNEVRSNYGVGITAQGGSQIIGNHVHDNGQMGIGGNGADIVVEGNEIASNGTWSGIDPFWEGGGTKFAETTALIVRDNYSHDNRGFGLWTDIDNIGTLYEGNLVVNNDGGGINHEISYDAVIRNNTFAGNGTAAQGDWLWGAAVQIQNSQNVEIYGNRIDMSDGLNGIALIQQDRGAGAYGAYTTTGNTIHDNVLVSTGGDGRSGGVADFNEAGLLDGNNVFSNNQYYMDGGNHWWWGDFASGDTWAAYQADTNQDNGSVVIEGTPPDTLAWLSETGSIVVEPVVTEPVITEPVVTEPALPEPAAPEAEAPATPDRPAEPAPVPSGEAPVVDVPATTPATSGRPVSADGTDIVGTAGADVLRGQPGSVEIYGLAGDDTLHADVANELLFGGAGSDLFVFTDDGSTDSIEDMVLDGAQHDRVSLPADLFASFDDVLDVAVDTADGAVILVGSSQVIINETNVASLQANDFLFV